LPERVTEHHHAGCARLLFVFPKDPADGRLHAEDGEEIRRRGNRIEFFRVAGPRQVEYATAH
jgi:hypothetical protein